VKKTIDEAYFNIIDTIQWWINSGLELKYSEKAFENLYMRSQMNRVDLIKWWENSGLELKYSEKALEKILEMVILMY